MGSSSSKVAKTASSTARRYPATSSIPTPANPPTQPSSSASRPGPTLHPTPSASSSKDQYVDLDGRDPDFGSRLSRIGPVQPAPTASHSSTFAPKPEVLKSSSTLNSARSPLASGRVFPSAASNPSLLLVQARDSVAKVFEEESEGLGRASFKGRTLISAAEIKSVLTHRDEGRRQPGEIEKQLRLRSGLVAKLGEPGVVGNA